MSVCPEKNYRDGLTDPEFWDYVLLGQRPGQVFESPDDSDVFVTVGSFEPCPECGETVACGYDSLGRPMIHVTTEEQDS